MDLMRQLELEQMKTEIPDFGVGDTVQVHYLIREGEKERIQVFTGTVIAIRGSGIRRSVVVRRLVAGQGVERIFPIHSPRVQDIVVKQTGRIRRAKLYYLRDRVGKAVRLRANFGKRRGPRSGRGSGLDLTPSPRTAAEEPGPAPAAEAPAEAAATAKAAGTEES